MATAVKTRSAIGRPAAWHPAAGGSSSSGSELEALHTLQRIATEDPTFVQELRLTGSTQEAADFVQIWGIDVSAEALWRNRGRHGLPTWRG
jgi:hypothetical protein